MCFLIIPRFHCNHPAGHERIARCAEVPVGYIHISRPRWPELYEGICKNCQEDLRADSENKPRKERRDQQDADDKGLGGKKRTASSRRGA